MFKFLRDAQWELEHVVWPTPNETKKYMMYNVVVIIVTTVFLVVLGYFIQSGLVAVRAQFPHEAIAVDTSGTVTQSELDDITDAIEKKKAAEEVSGISPVDSPALDVTPEVSIDASGVVAQ